MEGFKFADFDLRWLRPLKAVPTSGSGQTPLRETLVHLKTGRRCQFFPGTAIHDPPRFIRESLGQREQTQISDGLLNQVSIKYWLRQLKLEMDYWDRLDPWEEKWKSGSSFRDLGEIENRLFTPQERHQIIELLTGFRNCAEVNFRLTAEQTSALNASIDFLSEESNRLDRKFWLQLAYGILGSYLLTLFLPAEDTRSFLIDLLRTLVTALYPELRNGLPPGGSPSLLA